MKNGLPPLIALPIVLLAPACGSESTPDTEEPSPQTTGSLEPVDPAVRDSVSIEPLIAPDLNGHTLLERDTLPKDPWGDVYMYEPPTGEDIMDDVRAARQSKVEADITAIVEALYEYCVLNNGTYPDSLEALITPDENGVTLLMRDTLPKDPWGREYMYESPTREISELRVFTYGADGAPGGEGDDRDVDNVMIRDRQD